MRNEQSELVFQLGENSTKKILLSGVTADIARFDALLFDDVKNCSFDLLRHRIYKRE